MAERRERFTLHILTKWDTVCYTVGIGKREQASERDTTVSKLNISKITAQFATEEQRTADEQLRAEESEAERKLDADFVSRYGWATNDNPWTDEQLAEYAAAKRQLADEYNKRFAAISK